MSIKSGGIKLVLWTETPRLIEMMWSLQVFSTCECNDYQQIELGEQRCYKKNRFNRDLYFYLIFVIHKLSY